MEIENTHKKSSKSNNLSKVQETQVRLMIWRNLAIAVATIITLLGGYTKCYFDGLASNSRSTLEKYNIEIEKIDQERKNKISGHDKITIGLITDFGSHSYYVGKLRGTILRENPHANLIDISHNIRSFDIVEGGWTLFNAAKSFKDSSIFLAIVNPGADLDKSIFIETEKPKYFFIGVDKSIFDYVAHNFGVAKSYQVTLNNQNDTFGTYTFSTIVNSLAKGKSIKTLVSENNLKPHDNKYKPKLISAINNFKEIDTDRIEGYICAIDKWGNLITNIKFDEIKNDFFEKGSLYNIEINGIKLESFVYGKTYEDGKGKNGVIMRQDEWVQLATFLENTSKRFLLEKAGSKFTISKN